MSGFPVGCSERSRPYRYGPPWRATGVLGRSLAAGLGDKPVALMRGHVGVVVGPNARRGVRKAIYTEVNARLQTIAIGIGGPINYISAEEGAAMRKQKETLVAHGTCQSEMHLKSSPFHGRRRLGRGLRVVRNETMLKLSGASGPEYS
jgi:hypothetical protein